MWAGNTQPSSYHHNAYTRFVVVFDSFLSFDVYFPFAIALDSVKVKSGRLPYTRVYYVTWACDIAQRYGHIILDAGWKRQQQ